MIQLLKKLKETNPLFLVLSAALLVRLIASFFSMGYGMHDDHFCVIEPAQNWLDGIPITAQGEIPIRNFFYTGFHYLLFGLLQFFSISDPQTKMLFTRIIHALLSLIIVWGSYQIAFIIKGKNAAWQAGIFCALFWLLPFGSVRNLVEVVCIIPLTLLVYYTIRISEKKNRDMLIAGIMSGLAFSLRYQCAPFIALIGLFILYRHKLKGVLLMSFGFLLITFLVLGVPEWILIGKPFATFIAYFTYNSNPENIMGYTVNAWYTYLGTIIAFLIPPTSLFLIIAACKNFKKTAIIILPTFAFLLLHIFYPNKQERFIFPIFPFILISAAIGIDSMRQWISESKTRNAIYRYLMIWFWVINSILLVVGIFTYSKKTRVESMYYLYNRGDVKALVAENELNQSVMLPTFYLGKQCKIFEMNREKTVAMLQSQIKTSDVKPNYIIFFGNGNINKRVQNVKTLFPDLTLIHHITPSLADQILFLLNPKYNINQTCHIYSIKTISQN